MDERVARRYARALFNAAKAAGALQQVSDDLGQVETVIGAQPELESFVDSPLVTRDRKSAALGKLFAGQHILTRRLLTLLVEKGREEQLEAMHREYDRLFQESEGVIVAVIQCARPLPAAQRSELITAIERQSGKRVTATDEVDPALVGGVRVLIGDNMLDGTVSGDLRRLRDRFVRELARQA